MRTLFLLLLLTSYLQTYSQNTDGHDTPTAVLNAHAKSTPNEIENNLEALTIYLTSKAQSDRDKVMVFFYWIANNISYDIEAYYEDVHFTDYRETLDRQRGICQNFAALMQAMCKQAGLEAYVVSGYAKGYYHESGAVFEEVNHAWNVVKLGDEYYGLDATFGSGRMRDMGYGFRYEKHIDLDHILVRGGEFADEHLPADPRWQLSDTIVSMQAFVNYGDYDKMKAQSALYQNYKEEIEAYKQASIVRQRIISMEQSYLFHPTDYIIKSLGSYCHELAYELSLEATSRKELEEANSFYDKAIWAYSQQLSKAPEMNQWISQAEKGKAYIESRLRRIDK